MPKLNLKIKPDEKKGVPKNVCRRCAIGLCGGFVFVATIFVLAILALLGRLYVAPLHIDFAQEHVQALLQEYQSDFSVQMNHMYAHWPKFGEPILFLADEVSIYDQSSELSQQAPVFSTKAIGVNFSISEAVRGRVAVERLIVREPALHVKRDVNGQVNFDFGAEGAARSDVSLPQLHDFLSFFQGGTTSALRHLMSVSIEDAGVVYDDLRAGHQVFLEGGGFDFVKKDDGLHFTSRFSLIDQVDQPPARGSGSFFIPWDGLDVRGSLQFADVRPDALARYHPLLARLKGQRGSYDLTLAGRWDAALSPLILDVDVESSEGVVDLPDYYSDGLAYRDLDISVRYDRPEKLIYLDHASAVIGGVPLNIQGDFALNDGELTGPVDVSVSRLEHAQIAPLWPESMREDASYRWAVQKTTSGRFEDVSAQFYVRSGVDDLGVRGFDVESVMARLSFSQTGFDYRAPLAPVSDASGEVLFDLEQERLDVRVESGSLGGLTVSKAHVILADIVDKGQADADIKLSVNGPLSSVLSYIAAEPIGAKTGLKASKVQGRAALDLHLVLPLYRGVGAPAIQKTVSGVLSDVVLPKAFRGMDVRAGSIDVDLSKDVLSLGGKGTLSGAGGAFTFTLKENLKPKGKSYKRKLDVSLDLTKGLRQALKIGLEDYIVGTAPAKVVYRNLVGGKALLDFDVNAGPLSVRIDALNYLKSSGAAGRVRGQAALSDGRVSGLSGLDFTLPDLSGQKGKITLSSAGDVRSVSFPRFALGATQGSFQFDTGKDKRQTIDIVAGRFDLQPFLSKSSDASPRTNQPVRHISVTADAFQTSDAYEIRRGKLYLVMGADGLVNQLEMDAVSGNGDLYVRYKPSDTGHMFKMEAGDAGATLKAFGLYTKMRGGKILIEGSSPVGSGVRRLTGRARLHDFRIVKAPGLAKLLGAMSLNGISDLLNNDGLAFSKLSANFKWDYGAKGSVLTLKDGRTSGNSVGFTFDGTMDNVASVIDLSGTVVPLSGINKAVSEIPLIGDILSGGTGSIFAVTYTMKGPYGDPRIVVNPLAVLAPGLLRRILFEN